MTKQDLLIVTKLLEINKQEIHIIHDNDTIVKSIMVNKTIDAAIETISSYANGEITQGVIDHLMKGA